MWSSFFLACLAGALLLYVPGALALKALRYPSSVSFIAAPIPACLFYAVAAVLCGACGITLSGKLLFVVATLFAAVLLLASLAGWCFVQKRTLRQFFGQSHEAPAGKSSAHPVEKSSGCSAGIIGTCDDAKPKASSLLPSAKLILLYVCAGLALGFYIYVKPLGGPNNFPLSFDDLTHLGLLRTFIESGNYSTLTTTIYPDFENAARSYYPALWHLLAAMIATTTGVGQFVAANALNYLITSVVYPLGVVLLLSQVFGANKKAVVAGSFICLLLLAFPWGFLIIGRLLANLMGFVFVPLILACLYCCLAPENPKPARARAGILFLLGCALAPFAQPNLLFSIVVLGLPLCLYRIWTETPKRSKRNVRLNQLLYTGLLLVVVCAFWAVCLNLPFMRDVLAYEWKPSSTIGQAIIDIFFVCSSLTPVAPILAFFQVIGICVTIKDRRYLWITATFAFLSVMYVSCAATSGALEIILTGFWYTDKFRISALLAMVQTMLIVLGVARVCLAAQKRFTISKLGWAVLSLLLTAAIMFPSFTIQGVALIDRPFGHLRHSIHELYRADVADDEAILSQDERLFIEAAKKYTGDSIIYNQPYDGSTFAYLYNGLKTYTRAPYKVSSEAELLLNTRLSEYGTNKEVQDAAKALGVEYVILLDQGHEPFADLWTGYQPSDWIGFEGITPDTPGFELVLSEGDMSLYRLNPL